MSFQRLLKKLNLNYLKIILLIFNLFIIYIYFEILIQTYISIYISPDISVKQYWESGQWKW